MSPTALLTGLFLGLILGAVVAWVLAQGRRQVAESRVTDLSQRLQETQTQLAEAQGERDQEREQRVRLETQLAEVGRHVEEQRAQFEQARASLIETFKALSADVVRDQGKSFLDLARSQLETLLSEAKGDLGQRQQAIETLVQPLREVLTRYESQLRELEEKRQTAYGSLERQLQDLNRETDSLVRALRSPQVRGAWGELTLRNAVELAGLSAHCDFVEQASLTTEEARLRPDMVVRLPGGRIIIVDAKTPLEAYLEAMEAQDETARTAALQRHAQHVRGHVRQLSSRQYAQEFRGSADFVLLFLPGESFFSAALEQDRELYTFALQSRILLCSPTSLVAHLRAAGVLWHEQQIIENANAIAEASRDFFRRVNTFVEHLAAVGDGLKRAEDAYNRAVGSWQSRVAPAGRKVAELGGAQQSAEAAELEPIEVPLRELPPPDPTLTPPEADPPA